MNLFSVIKNRHKLYKKKNTRRKLYKKVIKVNSVGVEVGVWRGVNAKLLLENSPKRL